METWERRRDLGRQTLGKRRVYLDLRFWNDLCDSAIGESASPSTATLLSRLRREVAAQKLICPIEFHVLEELYHQRSENKRRTTAKLVDELSLGTVLVSAPERVFLEVLRFQQAAIARRPASDPPADEMWTKPLYLAGHISLPFDDPALPAEVVAELRRSFEDHMWNLGFSAMLTLAGPPVITPAERARTADILNRGKQDARSKFSRFDDLYASELRASLEGYKEQLAQVGAYMYHRGGGNHLGVAPAEYEREANRLANLIAGAMAEKDLRRVLPSLHIGAMLHAHVEWDMGRQYKANDFADFGHAEAALPYCDAFATEKSLSTLLRHSKLAETYQCALLTDTQQILEWLDVSLTDGRPSA